MSENVKRTSHESFWVSSESSANVLILFHVIDRINVLVLLVCSSPLFMFFGALISAYSGERKAGRNKLRRPLNYHNTFGFLPSRSLDLSYDEANACTYLRTPDDDIIGGIRSRQWQTRRQLHSRLKQRTSCCSGVLSVTTPCQIPVWSQPQRRQHSRARLHSLIPTTHYASRTVSHGSGQAKIRQASTVSQRRQAVCMPSSILNSNGRSSQVTF